MIGLSWPVLESAYLPHGQVLVTPSMIVVGTAPLDRAERIRRAARHEARLLCRMWARDLGHDCPDPVDEQHQWLPTDELQVKDGYGVWRWLDLREELAALARDGVKAEQERRDREALDALEEWQACPWLVDGVPVPVSIAASALYLDRELTMRPYPQHSSAVLRGERPRTTTRVGPGGFVYVDYQ